MDARNLISPLLLGVAAAVPAQYHKLWSAPIPTYSEPYVYGQHLALSTTGNVAIGGVHQSGVFTDGTTDVFVRVYGPTGTFLWGSDYDGPAHGPDTVNGLAFDPSGNLFVAGSARYLATKVALLRKFDAKGKLLWDRVQTGGGGGLNWNSFNAVATDKDGRVGVAGSYATKDGTVRATATEYSASGALIGTYRWGGPGSTWWGVDIGYPSDGVAGKPITLVSGRTDLAPYKQEGKLLQTNGSTLLGYVELKDPSEGITPVDLVTTANQGAYVAARSGLYVGQTRPRLYYASPADFFDHNTSFAYAGAAAAANDVAPVFLSGGEQGGLALGCDLFNPSANVHSTRIYWFDFDAAKPGIPHYDGVSHLAGTQCGSGTFVPSGAFLLHGMSGTGETSISSFGFAAPKPWRTQKFADKAFPRDIGRFAPANGVQGGTWWVARATDVAKTGGYESLVEAFRPSICGYAACEPLKKRIRITVRLDAPVPGPLSQRVSITPIRGSLAYPTSIVFDPGEQVKTIYVDAPPAALPRACDIVVSRTGSSDMLSFLIRAFQ